jgi:hypothetical protein
MTPPEKSIGRCIGIPSDIKEQKEDTERKTTKNAAPVIAMSEYTSASTSSYFSLTSWPELFVDLTGRLYAAYYTTSKPPAP